MDCVSELGIFVLFLVDSGSVSDSIVAVVVVVVVLGVDGQEESVGIRVLLERGETR